MSLYEPTGELVLFWALTEQTLDHCVGLFFRVGGRRIEPEIPRALAKKIRFCRKCLTTIPHLALLRERGQALLSEMKRLSALRHTIVHGTLAEYDKDADCFIFARLKTSGSVQSVVGERITRLELAVVGDDCLALLRGLRKFSDSLLKAFMSEQAFKNYRSHLTREEIAMLEPPEPFLQLPAHLGKRRIFPA